MAGVKVTISADVVKAIKNLEKFQRDATQSLKKVEKSSTGLRASFKRLGETAAGFLVANVIQRGFRTLSDSFFGAIEEAKQLEASLIGLKSVAAATGNDADELANTAKRLAADGLIPLREVSQSLKNLLATGLDAKEAEETFLALRDAAAFNRQGQLQLGEAVERATQGIKNQLSILVDNAGITKNLSILQREYAASIGTTVGKLNEQQKVQAIYVGILREARIFQGDYNKLLDTFSGATSRVEGQTRFLSAAVGELFTRNRAVVVILREFSDAIEKLRKFIEENREELTRLVTEGIVALINAVPILIRVFQGLDFIIVAIANGFRVIALAVIGLLKGITAIVAPLQTLTGQFSGLSEQADIIAKTLKKDVVDSLDGLKNRGRVFDKAADAAERFSKRVEEGVKAANRLGTVLGKNLAADVISGLPPELQRIAKQVKNVGLTQIQIINATRNERLRALDKFLQENKNLTPEVEQQVQDLRVKINKEADEKIAAEREKQRKKELARARGATLGRTIVEALKIQVSAEFLKIAAIAGDVARAFQRGGREGAVALVSGLADAVAPGLGSVVSFLSQGTDAVKQQIQSVLESLPEVLVTLVETFAELPIILVEQLPQFIEKLVAAAPRIISALVLQAPRFVISLIKQAPRIITEIIKGIPKIISGFITEFIRQLPKLIAEFGKALGQAVKGIFGGIGKAVGGIGSAIGGALGGIGKGIGKVFGGIFQSGGTVPDLSSFRADSAVIGVAGGEEVLDRNTADKLDQFLSQSGQGQAAPQPVVIQIGERELASVLLDLSRQGFRTA